MRIKFLFAFIFIVGIGVCLPQMPTVCTGVPEYQDITGIYYDLRCWETNAPCQEWGGWHATVKFIKKTENTYSVLYYKWLYQGNESSSYKLGTATLLPMPNGQYLLTISILYNTEFSGGTINLTFDYFSNRFYCGTATQVGQTGSYPLPLINGYSEMEQLYYRNGSWCYGRLGEFIPIFLNMVRFYCY